MSTLKSVVKNNKFLKMAQAHAEQICERNSSEFGIERAIALCDKALEINHDNQYGLDERQIILSSMFHSCMHHRDNDKYEEASAHFVYMIPYTSTDLYNLLTDSVADENGVDLERETALTTATMAVMEHRLSFQGTYSSMLSSVLYDANKELGEPTQNVKPVNVETSFGNNLPNAAAIPSVTGDVASLKY